MTAPEDITTETAAAPSIIEQLERKHERNERDQTTKRASALELYWRTVVESAADQDATATPEQVEEALGVLGLDILRLRQDIATRRNVTRVRRDRQVDDAKKRAQAAQQRLHDVIQKRKAHEEAAKKRADELRLEQEKVDREVVLAREDVRKCREEQDAAGRELMELAKRGYKLTAEDQSGQQIEYGRYHVVGKDGIYAGGRLYARGEVAVLPVADVGEGNDALVRLADGQEPQELPSPNEELLASLQRTGVKATIPSVGRRDDAGKDLPIINPRAPGEPPEPAPAAVAQTPPPPPRDGVEVLSGERLHESRKEMKAHLAQQEREERGRPARLPRR